MENNKNGKTKIWLYAVILFTSAFIVLVITAFSQIKFNKSIDNYRTQINTKENEKNKFQLNLNSAIKENEKLSNNIKDLEEQLKNEKEVVQTQKKLASHIENNSKVTISSYEKLLSAASEYDKGNLKECAIILKTEVKPETLSGGGLQKYNELVEKTYYKAAHMLYKDGLNDYENKRYDIAIENFKMSLEISDSEYFSDDCIYLLAYAKYRQGNREDALSYYRQLLNRYPDSQYAKKPDAMLKIFGN